MVKSMAAALAVPHFHYCDEIDFGALMDLRAALRGDPSLQGVKLTFLPVVVKALSIALLDSPGINAQLTPDESAIVHKVSHNIGVAMDTPSGLVVPNVKGVQGKSIAEIAKELARLHGAAAEGRLGPADLEGGTITISNIGSIGGTYVSPIVNVPQVAIVALGRVREVPRFDAAGAVARTAVMNVSWGADHRVVDGAALAGLCNAWKRLLEDPARILLRVR
mmetsp:Transcript_65970/g.208832  ORF Transcript_65970/g.208832 Transcript_65970/m.208832 type:complete len:221 (-) Transcript_65970:8-670(-)